jgi:hypothetical protein
MRFLLGLAIDMALLFWEERVDAGRCGGKLKRQSI